jgi:uncharacterized membrane protein
VTDSSTAAANPPKGRRWLWAALIISLALNLLFIGVTAGAFLMGGRWAGPRHRVMAAAMNEVVRTMPEERRKTAKEVLKRHRAQIRSLRRQAHKARRATIAAFRSDPFDEAAFKRAASELQTAELNVRKATSALALELGQYLTVDERRHFLRTLMQKRRSGRWRRRPDREARGPHEPDQEMPKSDDSVQDAPDPDKPDSGTPAPATP